MKDEHRNKYKNCNKYNNDKHKHKNNKIKINTK